MGKNEKGIPMSPKYGVNPTMPVCFWCGNQTGDLALLGWIRKKGPDGKAVKGSDLKAPEQAVLDYEPCEECSGVFKTGVRLVEVSTQPMGQLPAFSKDPEGNSLWPTGSFYVIKPEAAKRLFKIPAEQTEAGKTLCLGREAFAHFKQMADNPRDDTDGADGKEG